MQKVVHFISGLPRSGSTLLAAILRQNPRFHAGMSSPVASLFMALQPPSVEQYLAHCKQSEEAAS